MWQNVLAIWLTTRQPCQRFNCNHVITCNKHLVTCDKYVITMWQPWCNLVTSMCCCCANVQLSCWVPSQQKEQWDARRHMALQIIWDFFQSSKWPVRRMKISRQDETSVQFSPKVTNIMKSFNIWLKRLNIRESVDLKRGLVANSCLATYRQMVDWSPGTVRHIMKRKWRPGCQSVSAHKHK